jgi:hypothetical protein
MALAHDRTSVELKARTPFGDHDGGEDAKGRRRQLRHEAYQVAIDTSPVDHSTGSNREKRLAFAKILGLIRKAWIWVASG